MEYSLVFDVLNQPFQWWLPSAGLLIGFASLVIGLAISRNQDGKSAHERRAARTFGVVGAAFGIAWALLTFTVLYTQDQTCRSAGQANQTLTVEGRVENFQPGANLRGSSPEMFTVQGVTFAYKDSVVTCGFHQTSGNGGPIRSKLPVRVTYLPDHNNTILRLEIGHVAEQ